MTSLRNWLRRLRIIFRKPFGRRLALSRRRFFSYLQLDHLEKRQKLAAMQWGGARRRVPLVLERLEDRLAPATDFWTGLTPTGGVYNWNNPGNWSSSSVTNLPVTPSRR